MAFYRHPNTRSGSLTNVRFLPGSASSITQGGFEISQRRLLSRARRLLPGLYVKPRVSNREILLNILYLHCLTVVIYLTVLHRFRRFSPWAPRPVARLCDCRQTPGRRARRDDEGSRAPLSHPAARIRCVGTFSQTAGPVVPYFHHTRHP